MHRTMRRMLAVGREYALQVVCNDTHGCDRLIQVLQRRAADGKIAEHPAMNCLKFSR